MKLSHLGWQYSTHRLTKNPILGIRNPLFWIVVQSSRRDFQNIIVYCYCSWLQWWDEPISEDTAGHREGSLEMMDISFPDNQLSLYLEVRCRLGRAVTSPSTEPCMLQYRQTRKDVTTRATVACLLLGQTNCFLTRFEACPTGRRSCLVKNPWPGKSQGPEANLLLLFCQMVTMSNSL